MSNDTGNKSRKVLWVKLAMNYFDDPKFTRVSPLAELLYVRSIAFAKQDNTGFIACRAVSRIASDLGCSDDLSAELVDAGLWAVEDDGFTITNWSDWQEDAAKVEARREAGLVALHKRHSEEAPAKKCALCVDAGWIPARSPASTLPQERETEKEKERDLLFSRSNVHHAGVTENDFDAFWDAYPRKVGKADARKAWKSTTKQRPSLPDVLAALDRAKAVWARGDAQFIPHPATWIRQGRWDDEDFTVMGQSNRERGLQQSVDLVRRLQEQEADQERLAAWGEQKELGA